MKRGFTLMEVNLAILIMAGGILAMVSLFSLGFRENRQSREDVGGAAIADTVLSPMIMAASATNLRWSVFRREFYYPSHEGWREYFDSKGIVSSDPESRAENVFGSFMSQMSSAAEGSLDVKTAFPQSEVRGAGLSCGLVVMHDEDSPVVRIAFRATKQPGMLLAMPIYYTEVHFQGDPDK
jgi:Tfp pilus assembly protein PilV